MTSDLHKDPAPGDAAATVPFRTVLFSMVVLWATYFLLTTLRSVVMDFDLQFELGWRRLVVTVIGVGFTIVLWLLLRLVDTRPLWLKIFAAIALAMPVALGIGQVNYFIFKDTQVAQEQAYAKKYNLNLRRDESGNLLVDVPVRRVGPAPEGQPGAATPPGGQVESVIFLAQAARHRAGAVFPAAGLGGDLFRPARRGAGAGRAAPRGAVPLRRQGRRIAIPALSGEPAFPVQHAEFAFRAGDDEQG